LENIRLGAGGPTEENTRPLAGCGAGENIRHEGVWRTLENIRHEGDCRILENIRLRVERQALENIRLDVEAGALNEETRALDSRADGVVVMRQPHQARTAARTPARSGENHDESNGTELESNGPSLGGG
jgi:hypothetical protein